MPHWEGVGSGVPLGWWVLQQYLMLAGAISAEHVTAVFAALRHQVAETPASSTCAVQHITSC
jgi:hypothetical protein